MPPAGEHRVADHLPPRLYLPGCFSHVPGTTRHSDRPRHYGVGRARLRRLRLVEVKAALLHEIRR